MMRKKIYLDRIGARKICKSSDAMRGNLDIKGNIVLDLLTEYPPVFSWR